MPDRLYRTFRSKVIAGWWIPSPLIIQNSKKPDNNRVKKLSGVSFRKPKMLLITVITVHYRVFIELELSYGFVLVEKIFLSGILSNKKIEKKLKNENEK